MPKTTSARGTPASSAPDRPHAGRLIIYGAGGHGLVVAEAAAAAGWSVLCFVDDRYPAQPVAGWHVQPRTMLKDADAAVHVAIGHNAARQRVTEELTRSGMTLATVVHPTAWVSPSTQISPGVYIGPHAVVNGLTAIGPGAIINSAAVVEHHVRIGAFAHVGPRAVLAGRAVVGDGAMLGAGAILLPQAKAGDQAIIGAGAVVLHEAPPGQTVAGVPSKAIRPTPSPGSP
ncbi:MAG: acetyltransferase [Phycisphaeraceae bacterium]|nr:acetyltransferase [Phycisphaeraceae bacterium]